MKSIKAAILFSLGLVLTGIVHGQDFQYTYTSSPFTSLSSTRLPDSTIIPNPLSAAGSHLTFSFITNGLYMNTDIPMTGIVSYTAGDGVAADSFGSADNVTNYSIPYFGETPLVTTSDGNNNYLTTDANGNIKSWHIYVELSSYNPKNATYGHGVDFTSTWGASQYYQSMDQIFVQPNYTVNLNYYQAQSFTEGTWTVSQIAAVPEPSTYAMFLIGLGLLAFNRRRT